MAQHGLRVTRVGLSPNMAGYARRKLSAAGLNARVHAIRPGLPSLKRL